MLGSGRRSFSISCREPGVARRSCRKNSTRAGKGLRSLKRHASRQARAEHASADGVPASAENQHATEIRLRAGVQFSAANACHHDAECPLHPCFRARAPGPHCHCSVGADVGLSGRFRQLVHPDPRASRRHAYIHRYRDRRHRTARSGRAGMPRRFPCRTCPRKPSSSCWRAGIATAIGCSTWHGAISHTPQPGWARVQAICDFVHARIAFNYQHARVTRTASEAYEEQRGVCRDYAHLAIAFCRALNIPARYCTGYLSDIGTPLPYPAGDFAAWFEAYLGGQWHMFDPRTTCRASAGFCWRAAAMLLMSRSRRRSGPIR